MAGRSIIQLKNVCLTIRSTTLRDMLAYHERLSPEVRQFLITVDEHTLDWLRTAREEEIDEIIQGIKLIGVIRTVFKWLKAAFIIVGAVYLARAHLDDFLSFLGGHIWH